MTDDQTTVLVLTAGWVVVLAAMFRLRGSSTWAEWTGRGATSARLAWATLSALAAWSVAPQQEWTLPAALAVALWLGCIPAWWGSLGVRTGREVAVHSLRGLVWTGPAALVVILHGGVGWPLLLVGLLAGPVYLACRLARPTYAVQGAEWLWGGLIAAALLLSV